MKTFFQANFHCLRIWITGILLFFLTGCSLLTYNTATGRQEWIMISTPEEVSMGQAIHQNILRQYQFSGDQEKAGRINRIGQRLTQVSDRQDFQYHFFLIEKDELNAFTAPGGNIYFFTGLYDKLETDDQIAAVLAHEIGHCAARHTVKKFQAALGYDFVSQVILSQTQIGDQAKHLASLSSNTVMKLVFSAYGRQDEYEADRLGVKYMYLAHYDLNGILETFGVLEGESKGPRMPLILQTHPYVSDRVKVAQKEIESIKTQFEGTSPQTRQ